MKKAVILFNLGGPDSLSAVRPFLFNLFYDKRIINLPNPFRFLLAKFISKRRESTAQEIYEHIGGKSQFWRIHKHKLMHLNASLMNLFLCHPSAYTLGSRKKHRIPASSAGMTSKVFICMRYWHPFADDVVKSVKQFDPDEIILLPLYPQYSTTTTLSSIENWQKNAKNIA